MGWFSITFEGPHRVRDFDTFRTAFIQLWVNRSDDDRVAVYATRCVDDYPPDIMTAYLSPLAAEVALRIGGYELIDSARPFADEVALVAGNVPASDPIWIDEQFGYFDDENYGINQPKRYAA